MCVCMCVCIYVLKYLFVCKTYKSMLGRSYSLGWLLVIRIKTCTCRFKVMHIADCGIDNSVSKRKYYLAVSSFYTRYNGQSLQKTYLSVVVSPDVSTVENNQPHTVITVSNFYIKCRSKLHSFRDVTN